MKRGGEAFDWLVMAFLVVCWGSAFAALKIATAHIPPMWNTAGRLAVAALTLAPVLAVRREALPAASHPAWRFYLAIGFIGQAAPFALYAFAAQRLPSAVNAICNGASPIFTALLAHAFVASDRLTLRKGLGVLTGFSGLVILVAPRLQQGFTLETAGLAAALFGAVLYAVANVVTKRAPPVPSAVGALMMCLCALVFALPAAFAMNGPPPAAPADALVAMAALGVFSTGLATIGYVFLIQRRGPLFTSMGIYLAPIWATALGVLVLGERPGWSAFVALALILGGVGLASFAGRRG
ncbi:DMT family transporter [Phenylobacterium sp.]|jgi:drug/metabolite transporter (DMT)-like permease|uniref:DMT family transporter n=1 Tax=Phenylobacterium sp. TaxID=1871053 RepID=UPI002F942558